MWRKNKNLLVLSSLTLAFCIFSLLTGTVSASTGVSPDVSFEGKIVNSSGVNITNATYNVEFTMYTGCTNEPTNNTGCTLAWTEDYLTSASEGVAMNGGTFEVNLGQYCSFAGGSCQGNTNTGINWNSYPIYMSMQIGGTANCSSSPAGGLFTANCSGDGVMQPYILMTSTPYAQNASTVGGIAATSFAQLAAGSQTFTGANIFEDSTNSAGAFSVENNAAKNILGVDTSGNQVVFGNATTNVGQVVFDDGTNSNAVTINAGSGTAAYSLTLPTVAPTTSQCLESGASTAGLLVFATCGSGSGINNGFTLQSSASFDIQATSGHVTGVLEANGADILDLKNASAVNVATFGSTGAVLFENSTNSTTAFSVQTSAAANVLNVNTTNSIVSVGALATPGTLTATQAPLAGSLTGTAGSTSYTYEITAVSANGSESLASTETNAALAASITTNHITVNWTTNGAAYYKIYRTASGGTPSSLGLVGTSTTGSFVDTGYSAGAQPPALANTGTLAVSTNYYYEVTALDDTYTTGGSIGQTLPSAQLTATTNSYNKSLTINWAPVNGARAYNVYRTTTTGVYTTDSYYTVYTNSFTDTNATATGTNTVPPTASTAYGNDLSNNATANVTIGSSGTSTAQLYVGGQTPTLVGSLATGGQPAADYVDGSYLYVANYTSNTLQIFNISNPSSPILVGTSAATLQTPSSVSVSGQYAYVTNYAGNTVIVYNVANPSAPVQIGSVVVGSGTSQPAESFIQGRYLYVFNLATNTFVIVDISTPAYPVVTGSVSTGLSGTFGIAVQGNYAYVGGGGSSFDVINISNPYSPTVVSTVTAKSNPANFSVQGNYLYVADQASNTVQIFDISNPANPIVVGSVATGTGLVNVYAEGRYVYAAGGSGASGFLEAFDISNPADPVLAAPAATETNSGLGYLAIQGRYAYAVNNSTESVQVFDLGGAYIQQLQTGGIETTSLQVDSNASVSGNESITGGLTVGGSEEINSNLGIGGYAVIGNSSSINNVTSTAQQLYVSGQNPTFASQSTNANLYEANGIAVSGDYVFVASSGNNELVSYDVASGTPVYVGENGTNLLGEGDVYVQGQYAYVASGGNNEMVIFNISSGVPVYVSEINTDLSGPYFIQVQGDYAYVGNSGGPGLVVFNISNPASPVFVGMNTDGHDTGSDGDYIQGNYAYITSSGNNELIVYNISSGTPVYVGESNADLNFPTGVVVQGNYAYVASTGGSKIVTFDISSGTPVLVGENADSNLDGDDWLYVQGNYIYTTSQYNSKLVVYDISSGIPVYVGENTDNSLNLPEGIYVQGNYAYVDSQSDDTLVRFNLGGEYAQQLQVGGEEVGQLQVDTNENVNGNASITGGLVVGNSAQISGTLGVAGNISATGSISTSGSIAVAGTFANMTTPSISSTSTSTSGGSLTAGTYYYEITAEDDLGRQTVPSAQVSQITTGSTSTVTLTWAPVAGASAYVVYRSTVSGVYTTDSIYDTIGTVSGSNLTFTDTGAVTAITNTAPPTTTTAQVSTNTSDTNLQVSIGGNGTPTSQLYVSGTVPTSAVSTLNTGAGTGPNSLYVQGQYAYVFDGSTSNFQVINISDPSNPVIVGTTATDGSPNAVFVAGNYAYVTDWSSYLQIINVSNPSNPTVVSSVEIGGGPIAVYAQGNYVYTVQYGGGLQVINVANPSNPVIVGNIITGVDTDAVFVQGNYAYVGSQNSNTFQVVNVSNPADPVVVSTLSANTPVSIFVQGSYAYVGGNSNPNLLIINISNPASPVTVGSISGVGTGQSVYVQGNYAYLANWGNTLQVVNVSNPTEPALVGTISTGFGAGGANGVFVQGRYAYDTNGAANTLQIFDMGGEYTQQLQAGGVETSTLEVDSNANVGGNESIEGGLTVAGTTELSGSTNVSGNLTIVGLTQLEGVTAINGVYGGYSSIGLATPTAPTVTFSGVTGGAVTWSYEVEAIDAAGNTTAASPVGSITSGDSDGLASADTYTSQTVSSTTFATPHVTYNVGSGQPYITGMGISVSGCSGTGADNGTYTITSETTSTIVVSNASGVAGETGCVIAAENDYNTISWTAVSGAVNYYVFRTAYAAGGSPSTTGFIGATTATSLQDMGQAGTGTYLAQSNDTTNNFVYKTATNSTTAFQVQNALGNAILSVSTTSSAQVTVNANLQVNGVSVAGLGAAVVQQSDGVANGTATATFTGNTTVGNTLVLMAQVSSATDVVGSVTGGGVSTWIKIPGASIDSGGYDTEMWYGAVTTSGSNTITVVESASGSDAVRLIAAEVAGVTATPVDQSSATTYTSTTSPTTPSINTTSANEIIFGYAKDGGTGSTISSPTNGFTQLNQPVVYNALAYYVANSTGTYSTSFTASPADTGEVGIVSFKLASSLPDIIDLNADTSNTVLSVNSTGATKFENVSNSTTALSVQNSAAANVLNVNTTNSIVSVGALATPGTLTATQAPLAGSLTGTAGSTSYTYEITAVSANGSESLASTETNAALAASITTNHITVNWTTNGAAYYKIYRTASGGTPSSLGLVGTSTTGSFVDTGYSAGAQPPALANTGTLAVSTNYYYEVTALDDTYTTGGSIGQTLPSAQLTATTNSYNKSLTINWAPVNGARAYNVYRTTTTGVYTTDSYYTVYTNSFTDTNATATGTNVVPPTTDTAYGNDLSNNAAAQITVGGNGTETGQLYVGGQVPTTALSTLSTGSSTSPYDVYVQGDYAYVTDNGTNALQVINIANPDDPVIVGSVSVGSCPGEVQVEGNYAYVQNYCAKNIQVVNVSDPEAPVVVGTVTTGYATYPGWEYVQGNYDYVTSASDYGTGQYANTLQIINVSNPANPVITSTIAIGTGNNFLLPIYVQGSYAYVVNSGNNTIQIINISNPASPVISTALAITSPGQVYVQGNYLYVTQNNYALEIFDISNPANPVLVGSVPTGGGATSVYVQGNYAYISEEFNNALQVVNVSNPADPIVVGGPVTTGSQPIAIFVQGRYVYIANISGNSLQVFDMGGAYIQQLQTGGIETGTLQVDSNASVSGDESIAGGLQVSSSAQVNGSLGVGSNLTVAGLTTLQGFTAINGVYGGYSSIGLAAPSAPTITFGGTAGAAATWSYEVEAVDAAGNTTAASPVGSITTGDSDGLGNYISETVSSTTFATPHVTYNVPSGQPYLTGMGITVTGCSGTGADNGSFTVTSETTSTIVVSNASGVAGETGCIIAVETNSNIVSWSAITGAVNYYVFRTADAAGGSPSTTGYIGSTSGTSFVDGGTAGTATYLAQATDSTNSFIDKTATNSATAFQVDNAVGSPIFLVSTVANNLLSYPGFEVGSFTNDAAGWQAVGTGTISQNSTLADTYNGLYSLKLITTTTAGAGAQTDAFTSTVAAGTYDVSFYAYPSVAMNANAFTVTLDDTTTHTCTPAAATLSTVGFTLLNCSVTTTGNLTYLSITQNDTTARTIYIDAVQLQSGSAVTPYSIGSIQFRGPIANPVTFEAPSNSQTAFQVLNASNANLLNIDSLDGIVEVGSTSSTNTTQTLLQLNSDNTFTEAASCSTTTNQGALYYNNASNNVRACINGSWQDLISTQALATLLFGVVPNSGNDPSDLVGASATAVAGSNTGGPCKVNVDSVASGASSVYVNSCLAYSGGREVSVPATLVSISGVAASSYQNICLNSSGVPALEGTSSTTSGSETFNNLTPTNGTTYGQPLLCLATIKTTAVAGTLSNIYDARTFTNTTKTYETLATVIDGYLGAVVSPSATSGGFVTWATTATSVVEGVEVASTGSNGVAGSPNVIIAIDGPQWIFGTGGTVPDFVGPTTTSGAANGTTQGTTALTNFDTIGTEQNTYATGCTVQTFGASDCQYSIFTIMNIQ